MTRDEAVALVRGRLSRFTGTDQVSSYVVEEMKAFQQELEEGVFLPWFLLTEASSTSLTIGDERIKIPSDFIREAEKDALWVTNASGQDVPLNKNDYDYLKNRYRSPGIPSEYALVGDYFRLFPVPDAAYTVKMIYFAKDAVLATDVENKWLKYASALLINGTGAIIAQYLKNKEAQNFFIAKQQSAYKNLMAAHQAREDANRLYVSED